MRDNAYDPFERRRTTLRIIFFLIIVGTVPFYIGGFVLWGTAPANGRGGQTPIATITPVGADNSATPSPIASWTPQPTRTPVASIVPPPQFVVPTSAFPTAIPTQPPPTETPFIPPTPTDAPTLTPIPSPTPIPPATDTPLPPPTDTPLPPPTATTTATPTATMTATATATATPTVEGG